MSDTTPGPMEQWAITNYFDKGALLLPYLREQDAERAVLEQERDQLADKVKWENDFWDLDKKWSQRYRELDAERAALEQRVAELEAALEIVREGALRGAGSDPARLLAIAEVAARALAPKESS